VQSRPPSTPFGIIAASDEELAALERRVQGKVTTTVDGCRFVRGRIGATPVVLARTGGGRTSAETGMRMLIERERVGRVAIIGFSGGVSPGLKPGSLLVATRIVDRGHPAPQPDPDWSGRISRRCGVREATVVTVERILSTARGKKELWSRLPQDRPVAADLETAAMATVAASRGVPFVVIRAVSDPAEESLPLDFNECLDPTGRISRVRVVARAARDPRLIGPLWRLRGRARTCSRRLADAVCESIPGANP